MRLRSQNLSGHIKQGLHAVYWVSGDDDLLVQECVDQLRNAARAQGFNEREVIDAVGGINWNLLYSANQSLSLFGDKKIIELRLDKKLDTDGQAAVISYCQNASHDNILIITSPRIEGATLKTKWFGKIDNQCVSIQIWPIERNQLPAWLQERAATHGLTIDHDAVQLLVDRVEGNLLAAKQELDKLALTSGETHISAKTIVQSVANSSRYSVFDLGEPLLIGDYGRLHRVCQGLIAEGIDMTMLNWSINRELRLLHKVLAGLEQGQSPVSILKSERIPEKRHAGFNRASQRLTLNDVNRCLQLTSQLDIAIKGGSPLSKELCLQQLLARCCSLEISTF